LEQVRQARRSEFVSVFLKLEDEQFFKLNRVFLGILFLSIIGSIIEVWMAYQSLMQLFDSPDEVGNNVVRVLVLASTKVFGYSIVAYVAVVFRGVLQLRRARIENEVYNMQRDKKENADTTAELIKAVRQRTSTIVRGNNINFIGGDNFGNVSITVRGGEDMAKAIGTLLAYTERVGNQSAIVAAKEIASESTKPKADKGKVFRLWSGIASALPSVLDVKEIVDGISKLVSGDTDT
jgi:hypothetical protein